MIEPQKDYRLCLSRSRRFKNLLVKERYWYCLYQVDKLRVPNTIMFLQPLTTNIFIFANFFYYYTEKRKLFFTFATGQHGFIGSIMETISKAFAVL